MTDNYNDDYREVIPEEEKTETTLNEKKDNEKNSENTQVADTAGENSAEKKTEDKNIIKNQNGVAVCQSLMHGQIIYYIIHSTYLSNVY